MSVGFRIPAFAVYAHVERICKHHDIVKSTTRRKLKAGHGCSAKERVAGSPSYDLLDGPSAILKS